MTTKFVGITAIVAALFFGTLAMGGHVNGYTTVKVGAQIQQVYDPSHGDCGQRGFSWEYCGYTQHQPTMNAIDWGSADGNLNNPSCEHHCYSGGSSGGDNAFVQQPKIQTVAFQPDNCFWSYPVQCQPS